jgi:hypothetical protein
MATKNWLDGTADWYTPADWTGGTNPGPAHDVVITTGAPFTLIGDPAITVNSITITGSALLTVAGNYANAGVLDVDVASGSGRTAAVPWRFGR